MTTREPICYSCGMPASPHKYRHPIADTPTHPFAKKEIVQAEQHNEEIDRIDLLHDEKVRRLGRELDEAQKRHRLLHQALSRYGKHQAACPCWSTTPTGPCSCGLSGALTGGEGK